MIQQLKLKERMTKWLTKSARKKRLKCKNRGATRTHGPYFTKIELGQSFQKEQSSNVGPIGRVRNVVS